MRTPSLRTLIVVQRMVCIGSWLLSSSLLGQSQPEIIWLQGGHASSAIAKFSTDGNLVASAGLDGTVKLWRTSDGSMVRTLTDKPYVARSLAFSPDGLNIAVGGDDGSVKIWTTSDGLLLGTFKKHTDWVVCVAFSHDGVQLATASYDGLAKVFNVRSGKTSLTLDFKPNNDSPRSVTFGPDDNLLFVGLARGAGVHNTIDGTKIGGFSSPTNLFLRAVFTRDLQTLVCSDGAGWVRIWATDGWTSRTNFKADLDVINTLAVSPDGNRLLTFSRTGKFKLWNVHEASLLRELSGYRGWISSTEFSPGGETVLTGEADGGFSVSAAVRLWRVENGAIIRTLTRYVSSLSKVACSPDGALVAAGGREGPILLSDAVTGELRHSLEGDSGWISGLAFSRDGQALASGGADRMLRFWNTGNGNLVSAIPVESVIRQIEYSSDGQFVVVGTEASLIIFFRASDGTRTGHIAGISGGVESLAVSPDGQYVASGGYFGPVHLWSISNRNEARSCGDPTAITRALGFSPDGTLLAGSDQDLAIRVWRVADGTLVSTLRGHRYSSGDGGISALKFSPDGRFLISSSASDNTIKFWRLPDGVVVKSFTKEVFDPRSLAFPATASFWICGRGDGTVFAALNPYVRNAASPLRLEVVRNQSLLELEVLSPTAKSYTVLESVDLMTWRRFTNSVAPKGYNWFNLPVMPERDFFRAYLE